MERSLFGISTLIASVALLVWSIGDTFAYPQGPSVSLGANPIVTISCSASVGHPDYPNTNNKYVVPQGVDFIVTDIATSHGTQGLAIIINSHTMFADYRYSTNMGGYPRLTSGLKIVSGHEVYCTGAGFLSGYLAQQ